MPGSTIVSRTTVAEGNREKWTLSLWVKWSVETGSSYNRIYDAGEDTDILRFNESDASISWYSGIYYKTTNRAFRDPAAWYHLVCRYDSTAASGEAAGDRMRLYVNGVEETSLAASSNPPEAFETATNNTGVDMVFGGATVADQNLMGSLSHVHMCDGQSYGPDTFGSTDSTSGIWTIKTSPSVTYGTNGFFLKMEDRTNLDLDSGTNTFTFTTAGNLTATYDNPSNNFPTMNPLVGDPIQCVYSKGNLTTAVGGSPAYYPPALGTVGLAGGLWYFEMKCVQSADNTQNLLGFQSSLGHFNTGTGFGGYLYDYGYYGYNGNIRYNSTTTSYGNTWTTDDIIGCYIDLTASKLYFAKDGVIQNSGTGYSIQPVADTPQGAYIPAIAFYGSTTALIGDFNFGNGYFGTDLISSPEADEGGIGAFKYDPSVGTFDSASKDFRAICSKNIKLYGG